MVAEIVRLLRHPLRTASAAARGARGRTATRTGAIIVGTMALAFALLPVFQANLLQAADTDFFTNWDRESQAFVLADVEQQVAGHGTSPYGLQAAVPQALSPYDTFDALQFGQHPTATGYVPNSSSLGLQGRLFTALFQHGCTTLNCLNTVESGLFSGTFVLFVVALAWVTRRSFGLAVLVTGLLSPWVVSAAHNLYWVPWTWLLPALAACLAVGARRPRVRALAFVLVGVGTAVKATTGYEFLTFTTLLAASIPVIAHVLGRRRTWHAVARDGAIVFAVACAGFLIVLFIHALVAGDGSLTDGLRSILHDALKRTYGSASLGADSVTVESLKASPLEVLTIYLVDWRSSVLSIGIGSPFTPIALGPGAFWVMVVAAAVVVVTAHFRGLPEAKRDGVLLIATAAPAVSWFAIGKSHSYTATSVNFVLWYLVFIPAVIWVLVAAAGRARLLSRLGSLLIDLERSAVSSKQGTDRSIRSPPNG